MVEFRNIGKYGDPILCKSKSPKDGWSALEDDEFWEVLRKYKRGQEAFYNFNGIRFPLINMQDAESPY